MEVEAVLRAMLLCVVSGVIPGVVKPRPANSSISLAPGLVSCIQGTQKILGGDKLALVIAEVLERIVSVLGPLVVEDSTTLRKARHGGYNPR